ncbi:cell envelope integrity protein CreD [Sphingobacterium sp. LRF_L2]|uniref:cell envelope integrity protein CreD n=1 Tax=Sphingobacterium sp. LRF_L2 TaxID=3369421 RepID=UPI003F637384
MSIHSEVNPRLLKRGIYQTVVYNSKLGIKGDFSDVDFSKLEIKSEDLQWESAKLLVGLSDLKGLKTAPKLKRKEGDLSFRVSDSDLNLFEETMVVDVDLSSKSTRFAFDVEIDVRGSKSLYIFPTAEETAMTISGAWANPSFDGGFLPEHRTVRDTSFEASWRISGFSRKFPQQWTGIKTKLYDIVNSDWDEGNMEASTVAATVPVKDGSPLSLGQLSTQKDMIQVNFLESVNNYQKTTRVAKYGVLMILLTFTALFFTEILKKQRIHFIQYVLIGCGMILFYSLLLAVGEHVGFDGAYFIAGLATITLITSFVYAITRNKKMIYLFSALLLLFYSFIYLLMQLQDLSLLVGTVGIFVTLAVLMKLSTKVQWSQFEIKSK